ncbi:MAG: response regulator, partial [Magnetospirillum sp.]|nr:response regulator [Magnetospirillum sp.]
CRRHADRLTIEVWDTGIGIPVERIREIFEEFTQLGNPERDRNQGLGLGLAIVDRLSRLLGHSVKVKSTPGRGSLFSVEVPLAPAPLVSKTPRSRRRSRVQESSCVVVLIDDEPIVLKGLTLVLQGWGYQVLAAASEDEVMEQLIAIPTPPNIIVADYRLREGRTGTEAVAHIRNHYSVLIPSIIITGDTAPERLREAEASGLTILHKPIQAPALREILQEALKRPPSAPLH